MKLADKSHKMRYSGHMTALDSLDLNNLVHTIKKLGQEQGFQQVGISDCELGEHKTHFNNWLANKMNADMQWLERHAELRLNPEKLLPNTIRVISFRMNYLHDNTPPQEVLRAKEKGYVSRYALGRDYHKLIRKRLKNIAQAIEKEIGAYSYRVFTDSAPILEKAFAEKSGLGWTGKHTLLLNREAGSWFFLGEIYTDLPLPVDKPVSHHCGSCSACIHICPTQAIIAPYQLDAGKCISYLTIENQGVIEKQYRKAIGNRIFGCDDCQLICPWNKYAKWSEEDDFTPRNALDNSDLLSLFAWTEAEFLKKTEGSAIRRTGFQGWQRNIAVALGNAPSQPEILHALREKMHETETSDMVKEHIRWAIAQHETSKNCV